MKNIEIETDNRKALQKEPERRIPFMEISKEIESEIEKLLDAPSCYPEDERKPRELRREELYGWITKYNEVNQFYNIYGMDRCCSEPNDYWLDRGKFRKERHDINAKWKPRGSNFSYDYTIYMRDKLAFELFMKGVFGYGNEYSRSEGVIIGNQAYINDKEKGLVPVSFNEFCEKNNNQKMVFKQSFGCSGDSIEIGLIYRDKVIVNHNEYKPEQYFSLISDPQTTWLIQNYIVQHKTLMELNDTSVNTMRVITFNTGNTVVVARNVLRYGKKGSCVDNADKGGFVTGVSMKGELYPDCFNFSSSMRSINPYNNIVLPYYEEAIEIVKRAHSLIPELFTIGWDVAFGINGPIIIEGNDGWDPHIAQAPLGNAMRTVWNELTAQRKDWEMKQDIVSGIYKKTD